MLKPALRHTARGARHLLRIALLLGVVMAGIGVVALLALRYLVLPNVERFHADIAEAASLSIGRPVTIAHIEADWNGLRPRLLLSGVQVLDEQGQAAVEFPQLRNTVAWATLLSGELRFNSLELDSPNLLVRRDAQGRHYVAGLTSEKGAAVRSDAATSDWWLRHSSIVVRNGHIVWEDEMRAAAPLSLEHVELRIDNRGNHHRFALRATLATNTPAPIDLRGDLLGESFTRLDGWSGVLFAQLDSVDALALSEWFTLPDSLHSGRGALRVWLGMAGGKLSQVDADVDMRAVRVQLAADLPPLELQVVIGRLGWKNLNGGFEVSTQNLALLMSDGFMLKPTDLLLRFSGRQGYRSASGEVSANVIELTDINRIMQFLPADAGLKQRLLELSPQGRVSDLQASWQGDWDHLARYQMHARFEGIGLNQVGTQPGFSGLSGEVDGSDSAGTLLLDSHGFNVQAPDFLLQPLLFDQISARMDWQRNGSGWELKLNDAQVRNADIEGNITGGYQINDGPGVADLSINMARVSVPHVARYIPVHAFDEATYRWLQTGLQDGTADSFQMRVRGDLQGFPFPDGKDGLFKIEAKARDVAIEFDPGWPRIERAQAELLIQGRLLEVRALRAMTGGAALQNVKVVLPDTLADELVMQVEGEASDATQRSLDYIRNSPVRGYLDGYTDNIGARGNGLLKLQLEVPLSGNAPVKVAGSYRFADNEVDLGEHVPLLRNVHGTLTFTNDALQATGIRAQVLGGPAVVSLRSEGGVLRAHASGKLNVDSLPATYAYPLLRQLHGAADWKTEVSVKNKLADVVVTSDLYGLVSELPQPFTKAADERVALRFEQKDVSPRQDNFKLQYGEVISAELARTASAKGAWEIKRGNIVLGKSGSKVGKEGIWVSGALPRLSLEGWSGWSEWPEREGESPNIAGINVTVGRLRGYGSTVHQLNIRGSVRNGLVSTRVASREMNGDLIWQPQNEGKLLVRLKNAMLGEGEQEAKASVPTPAKQSGESSFPSLDVSVDKLVWKGRQLGRLEMLVTGGDGDVLLESLRLTNPDGTFNASGKWSPVQGRTYFNSKLDITNAGKILARSGLPESLRDGGGSLESNVVWNGSPGEFNYASLNGTLHLRTGKGRFLQANPGAAKLLGVLSLQALPKRISLDFTDVFSPGFQFDSIVGEAVIENGLLKTSDFKMSGAAAKISLSGEIDLERETQNLKVRVFPTVGDNVSLISFAAGPAVGVSVLLANKLLSDPLDKLVSFDYNVSGGWADPKVERIGQAKPQVAKPAGQ